MKLYGSYNEPEPVEMMDDDDSSNDSDDDMKSDQSLSKPYSNENSPRDYTNNNNNNNNHSDNNNNNILNSNSTAKHLDELTEDEKLVKCPEELSEEDTERKRFQIELEFVQSLANPNYLNFLAQRGYFKNQTFLNYLKYLMYWKKPEYVKYIMYPQCLSLLELLQHETFLKEILNAQCSKYIDEQLLLIWLHYKKKRDWIRLEPNKIPDGIEKLFDATESSIIKNTEKILKNSLVAVDGAEPTDIVSIEDAFAADEFLKNEKF